MFVNVYAQILKIINQENLKLKMNLLNFINKYNYIIFFKLMLKALFFTIQIKII